MPHRPKETAYWRDFGANIIRAELSGHTNTDHAAALQQNSRTFADISQQFVERADSLVFRTFYENEMLDGQLVCRGCVWSAYALADLKSSTDC